MSQYGINSTGWRSKTFAEVRDELKADWRGKISTRLRLTEDSVLGALLHPIADRFAEVWALLATLHSALDPRNAVEGVTNLMLGLSGTSQRAPRAGFGTATVNVEAGTYPAGTLIAHVVGKPTNRWVNDAAVEADEDGAYQVLYVSEGTGSSYSAPAGTLTSKAQNVTGWLSITNAADFTPGRDRETIEEATIRHYENLGAQGSSSADGIRADVVAVPGVQAARVFSNRTQFPVSGMPPKSTRIVIWDGAEEDADDDAIAQAILDSATAGTLTVGQDYGMAVDDEGNTYVVFFDRATVINIHVQGTYTSADGASLTDIKQGIASKGPGAIGRTVVYEKLQSGAFVDGVDDVPTFEISTDGSTWGEANITIGPDEIAVIDTGNIDMELA